jgi:hypothetical protein
LWSKRFGDAATSQIGYSVAVDGAGNVLLTGEFDGTVDFGGGPLTSAGSGDVFLAKFDRSGNHLWSKRFGDAGGEVGYSVAVDGTGNVLLAGSFTGTVDFGGGPLASAGYFDVFVAKFDSAGNHLWSKRFGDDLYQRGYSVAVDGAGGVLLTGEYYGTLDFGGGPLTSASLGFNDIYVAKLDGAGNHIWSKRFGDANMQGGLDVETDGARNVVLTGGFEGTVDFGGGPLTSLGWSDVFLTKFDSAGNHVWSKQFGDANSQSGRSVAVDGAGNVILTGEFGGTVDFGGDPLAGAGLAKFDSAGNHVWSLGFGAASWHRGESVAVDGAGNVLLTGEFEGTMDFGGGPLTSAGISDISLAKFNSAGNHLWSKRFGDATNQFGFGVDVDSVGDVLVAGGFHGTVDFGGGALSSAGFSDIFLAKFDGTCFGDVNGDGVVNHEDLAFVARNIARQSPFADVNGDGTVSPADLRLVIDAMHMGDCAALATWTPTIESTHTPIPTNTSTSTNTATPAPSTHTPTPAMATSTPTATP